SAGEQDSADSAAQSDTDSGNVNLANPGEEQDGGGLFTDDEAPSFFGVVFRFFGMMALMVALFYVAVRYIRKRAGGAFVSGNNDLVELVVSVPLVQGKFLQIVDVAGKLMVLGVSDAGVQMLSTVDDGITADRIRMWQSERGTVSVPDDLLTRITDMFKSADFRFWNHEGREDQNKKANFGEILRKQLPPDSVAAEQAAEQASAQRNGRRNVNQPDLIPNTDAEDAIDSPDDGADLKKLLRQQKKRLATLRKNNDA
ncbi:MAG: FliO/MopB family protein, partial [Leptospiraceae bacterium]|nr:FliO/MopB family protein [Leptospiraceae bacterium]